MNLENVNYVGSPIWGGNWKTLEGQYNRTQSPLISKIFTSVASRSNANKLTSQKEFFVSPNQH
jgi:hypothetical protein